MTSIGLRAGIVTACLAMAGSAHALSLTVVPAEHRIEVPSGDSTTRDITVTNNGSGPITVSAYAWDWWYDTDGSHKFAPPGTFDRSGATWVNIFPDVLIVPAGETQRLTVNVAMPGGSEGGYYAVAFVEARAGTPESEGFAMRPGGRVAVPLLMQATGTETHSVRLVNAEVEPPTDANPLRIQMQTLNVGDTHEFPEFMGAIRNVAEDEVVGRFRGNPIRLLPGQERSIDASWSGLLVPGRYEVIGSLLYGNGRSEMIQKSFSVAAAKEEDLPWVP